MKQYVITEEQRDILFEDLEIMAVRKMLRSLPELPQGEDREGESRAVRDVIAERRRQIEQEGYTPEHDDAHRPGELSDAGACYAMCGYEHMVPFTWPFGPEWWKPGGIAGRRKDLVKAAALIIAEIDRTDRTTEQEEG